MNTFPINYYTARRSAAREYDEVRIEVERREITRSDHPGIAAVGSEGQYRARYRALVDDGVRGEVDDAESSERGVREVVGAGILAQTDLRVGRIGGHETGLATGADKTREPLRGIRREVLRIAEGEETCRLIGRGCAGPRMVPECGEDGGGGRHAQRDD